MEQNGNYKKNMIVDLSPFFYFEAAGDSEGDLDQYHTHHHHSMMMMVGLGRGHDNEEDDAHSCSYDAWDNIYVRHDSSPSHNYTNNEGNINNNEACWATTTAQRKTTSSIISHHHHSYKHDDDDDDDDDEDDGGGGILMMESKKKKKMMNSSSNNNNSGKKASSSSYSREDYKCTSSEVMSTANSNTSRSKSCIDHASEAQKLSEKERSRLFWETCLAS